MAKEYITVAGGIYRISGTRVSLDSIVHLYREGVSAESMVDSYPSLTLEQVYGAIAFYLANRSAVDAYLAQSEAAAEREHEASRATNAELIAKLRRARDAKQVPSR